MEPIRSSTQASWRRWLDTAATVAMLVAAGTLTWRAISPAAVRPPGPQIAVPEAPQTLAGAALKGNSSARVAIIEYSEFECPYCGKFAAEVLPEIERAYIAPGDVLLAFRHLPLARHENARPAAEAGVCADRQGKFWPFHDLLFSDQKSVDQRKLIEHADALGITSAQFAECLSGLGPAQVGADEAVAKQLGISGTPVFLVGLINGNQVQVSKVIAGAAPLREFQKVLDPLLGR